MNEFLHAFFIGSLLCASIAVVLYTIPGILVLRCLGFSSGFKHPSSWLLSPAFGMCTYGIFSLAVASLIGYSIFSIILSWILFNAGIYILAKKNKKTITVPFCEISKRAAIFFLLGALLWGISASVNIFPAIYNDGLYLNRHIFDHIKIAVIDGIRREGLPPQNPYFSPDGNSLPLNYYYLWHFMASQIDMLGNASGWQADVGMLWFTAFSGLSLLCAIAIQLSRQRAGIFVLLFAFTYSLLYLYKAIFRSFLDLPNFLKLPKAHELALLWNQVSWAPQHFFSAFSVVILFMLISFFLSKKVNLVIYSFVIGLVAASAVSSSIWVGGVAFLLSSPILLLMLLWLRLPREKYMRLMKCIIIALPLCLLFSSPVLSGLTAEPASEVSSSPVTLWIFPTTVLVDQSTPIGCLIHFILYWIVYLPLCFGIVYIIGTVSLMSATYEETNKRVFKLMSIGGIIGFLMVTQFFQSGLMNNDLGWRAVAVPVMLLIVWGASASANLIMRDMKFKSESYHSCLVRWKFSFSIFLVIGLCLGMASFSLNFRIPGPRKFSNSDPSESRKHFLRQYNIWKIVRLYAGPSDIVQSNPYALHYGYNKMFESCVNLPHALFSNRRAGFSDPYYGNVYSFRYNKSLRQKQYELIKRIFFEPRIEDIRALRDQLKIKVILVDHSDEIWKSTQIEDSNIYRLKYKDDFFKVYVASN